jgi:hypothetical protein
MELEYTLEKSDFLTYQLFTASQSKSTKNKRLFRWLAIPVLYILLGIILYCLREIAFLIAFVTIAIIWFAFFPAYSRWKYKKHFSKHIDEHYKNRFNILCKTVLTEEEIQLSDKTGNTSIKLTEVENIFVISSHVFIKMNSGVSLLIPRDKVDSRILDTFISKLEKSAKIKKTNMTGWKWK